MGYDGGHQMEGAVFPPPMERPSKAAAFAGGDRLLEGLATLGGTRLRQVNSGTTNRPTGRHVGQFTSYKHPSGAPMPMVRPSSVSSASSGASYHLGSRSTTPSSQSSRGDSANKPLTLKNRDDRLALRESHDKILGKRENDIRRVFRSMDSNRNGKLCATEIKEGLKAYNFGLTDLHVERLIKALDKDGDGSVSYDEFMQILNSYTPLGDYTQGKTDNALQVTAPWENLHVTSDNFKVWNKELFPAPPYVAEDAQDASPEMVAADARTIRLISSRIYQAASRIRHVFRKLDTDKNGVVDREEFNIGIAKLGLSIPRHQIDRFFTLIDEDNKGYIDYVKFLERFDAEAPEPKLKPPDRSSTEALVSRLDLSAEEVAEVASGEKAAALRERLFGLSNPASTVFRRLDLNGDGHLDLKEFARVCRTLVPGFTDREAACVLADMDPASDGFLTYKDFSTAMASYRPPHPREHHNSANPPCDTTFRGMQGGTRSRLGDSCMLHGPGDSPPVNHRTVAQIYARVNQARTEASAPALNTLWRSLSAAAAAGVAGYAPGKPGYRTLEQVADASLPLSSSSSRPSTAPDGAARSSPCMQSNTSGPGAFGRKSGSARTRGTWASRSILNPSPGAPGGPPTGMALDPEWEDARRERLRNHAAYNAYKDTSYMTKPQKGCPSSWEEERQYEPRPGVGAKVRSTTEDERAEKTVARQRMEARCSRSASAIAARQQKDADFHDGRDAARLAVLSEQKRKQAERIYLYNQCEVLQTDRMTNTLFTHRRTEVAKDKQGGHAGTVMSRYG